MIFRRSTYWSKVAPTVAIVGMALILYFTAPKGEDFWWTDGASSPFKAKLAPSVHQKSSPLGEDFWWTDGASFALNGELAPSVHQKSSPLGAVKYKISAIPTMATVGATFDQ